MIYPYTVGSVGAVGATGVTGSVGGTVLQLVHTSSAVAPPQFTYISPTDAVAPNCTGTATQIF